MFEATTRLREKMPSKFLDMSAPALPISRRRGRLAARFVALLSAGALVSTNLPAQAQKGPPIIRDAEIEQLLKEYTQPILRVAGLSQQNIQVVIINDRSFNAFVADGRRIFFHAGALLDAETPNQPIGAPAHGNATIPAHHCHI